MESRTFTLTLEIENEINSNKHKKDPFQQKYLDLTTSTICSNDFDFLSRQLRLRASLITAQLTSLNKELDIVNIPESQHKCKRIAEKLSNSTVVAGKY